MDAQGELVRAKEDWERTFAAVPDLIALLDTGHRITRVNRAMAERLGCTPEQAVGARCFEVVHGLSAPPDFCPHTKMLASGKQERAEVAEARLGGVFDITIAPLRNAVGGLVGSVHVAHDITERKRAEQALQKSEEKYRDLVENINDVIYSVDAQGVITYASPVVELLFGHPAADLVGTFYEQYIHPDDLPAIRESYANVLAGRLYPSDYRFRRRDGEFRWVRSSSRPVLDAAGRVVGLRGMLRDITEMKQAEQALQESEQNFRHLAANALDGILIAADGGQHVYANRRAAEILRYAPEELLQTTQQDLVDPAEYPKLRQRLQNRIAGRPVPGIYETVFRRKDGTKLPVGITSTRTMWQGQTCALVFFRDVTERKRMENEVLQIADWEKTRIGQDLHDTLGQQLAGMAYLSQALAQGWKSQPQADTDKSMARIGAEMRHTMELVRQMARGLTPVAPGPNGLTDALRGVAERTQQIYGLACILQADEGVAVADRQVATHLFFIAQEAVTNAVRHGQARHIALRLTRNGIQGELSIQDDGVGLPVGHPAGSGLGLRIMRYRANLIGGTLALERVESGGTRVACRFNERPIG